MSARLTITVREGDPGAVAYTVTAEQTTARGAPLFASSSLRLDRTRLNEAWGDPEAYGRALGEALFTGDVRDRLARAWPDNGDELRLLLTVEPAELRDLHWHLLRAPLRGNSSSIPLAGRADLIYAGYVPTYVAGNYRPIGKSHLRALVASYSPAKPDFGFDPFDVAASVEAARSALAPIPVTTLVKPTLATLRAALAEGHQQGPFTILHLICHGRGSGLDVPALYLGSDDDPERTTFVTAEQLIDALQSGGNPPHVVFLAACESAVAATGFDGMAQRLVREVGVPGVVAMAAPISVAGASTLASAFYTRLLEHGEADRALAQARLALAGSTDALIPVCLTCAPGQPIFSSALDRELGPDEIRDGLAIFAREVRRRAPVAEDEFVEYAHTLGTYHGVRPEALGPRERERYDEALSALNKLSQEVLGVSFAEVAGGAPLPEYPDANPFPGMVALRPEQAHLFLGRGALVKAQAERLRAAMVAGRVPILAIGGPSGAGKSSLALAGIGAALSGQSGRPELAELRVDGLRLCAFRPAENPPAALAEALASLGGEPALLIVDQGEELFTLCRDEAVRRRFAAELGACGRPAIITFRDDYHTDLYRFPAFRRWLDEQWLVLLLPLDADELRDIVEGQTRLAGLRLEAGLGALISREAAAERAPLPLIQHALSVLWDGRRGPLLRLKEYQELKGLAGAITKTAERVYAAALARGGDAEQDLIARVIPELVLVEPGVAEGQPRRLYRRRRPRAELLALVPGSEGVIGQLVEARLLVTNAGMVELAHEALIEAWEPVTGWVEKGLRERERRDGELAERRRRRERLRAAAEAWEWAGRGRRGLYRGAELVAARELLAEGFDDRGALAFVAASEREEGRLARRSAMLMLALALSAVLVAVVAVWLLFETQRQSRSIASLALISEARAALSGGNSERALALILAAAEPGPARLSPEAALAAEAALADAAYRPGAARALGPFPGPVAAAAFSPDGRTVALAPSEMAALAVVDLADGRELRRIALPAPPFAVAFVDDGRALAGGADGTLRLWDLAGGGELGAMRGHRGVITAVAPLPGGRALSAGNDNTIRIWELASGAELRTIAHGGGVHSVAVSPDGALALSTGEGVVALWELATGRRIWRQEHNVAQGGLAILPGRREALIVSGALIRLDLDTGERTGTVDTGGRRPFGLAVDPSGERAAVALDDGRIIVVRLGDGARLATLPDVESGRAPFSLAFGPDDSLFSFHETGVRLRVWDLAPRQALDAPPLAGVAVVLFAPGGEALAVTDGGALIGDPATGATRAALPGLSVGSPACAPRMGARVAALVDISYSPTTSRLRVFDPRDGRTLYEQQGLSGELVCAALSSDGNLVAVAERRAVVLRRVADGGEVARQAGIFASDLAFSPDGEALAVGVFGGQVLGLRARDLAVLWRGEAPAPGEGLRVRYSPDGRLLAVGGLRTAVRLLDPASGAERGTLAGGGGVWALAFSPDGRLLATAGGDEVTRVWDVASGAELRRLAELGAVRDVSFTGDGRSLITLARDDAPRLWRIEPLPEMIAWARQHRYIPELSCQERLVYGLDCTDQ